MCHCSHYQHFWIQIWIFFHKSYVVLNCSCNAFWEIYLCCCGRWWVLFVDAVSSGVIQLLKWWNGDQNFIRMQVQTPPSKDVSVVVPVDSTEVGSLESVRLGLCLSQTCSCWEKMTKQSWQSCVASNLSLKLGLHNISNLIQTARFRKTQLVKQMSLTRLF